MFQTLRDLAGFTADNIPAGMFETFNIDSGWPRSCPMTWDKAWDTFERDVSITGSKGIGVRKVAA